MDTQHSAKIHKFYEVIKAQNSLALHQLLQAKPAHTGCSSHDPQLISPQPCNQHATNQQTRPCHHEIIHLMQFTCSSVKHTLPCHVLCIPASTMLCHVKRDSHISTHSIEAQVCIFWGYSNLLLCSVRLVAFSELKC